MSEKGAIMFVDPPTAIMLLFLGTLFGVGLHATLHRCPEVLAPPANEQVVEVDWERVLRDAQDAQKS